MTGNGEIALPSVITIDPPMSTDLDDAVAVTPQPDGSWVVDVCIADVTTSVILGSNEDTTAQKRGFTVYREGSIKTPMLSHDNTMRLSLLAQQLRPMVWVRMTLDPALKLSDLRFCRINAATHARLSYEEADHVLTRPRHYYHERVANMWALAQLLFAKRQEECGTVWDPELGIGTTDEGHFYQLRRMERHRSHLIIQELMVLTNHVLAKHAAEKGLALMFRNHVPRNLTDASRKRAAMDLKEAAKQGPLALADALMRYNVQVGPAELGLTPRGHWGLGLSHYAWFTSPLRRYSDIVNLRLLLDGEVHPNAEQLAQHLTEVHRENRRAGRKAQRKNGVAKAIQLLMQLKVQALRLIPFNEVVEACQNVDFVTIDLDEELQLHVQAGTLRPEDITMVLGSGREFFGTEAITGLLDWLLANKHALWRVVSHLQQEGEIPSLPPQRITKLTKREVVGVLKEHYDLPLDMDTLEEPDATFWQHGAATSSTKRKGQIKASKVNERKGPATHLNPKSQLHELAAKTGASVGIESREEGPHHAPVFHAVVSWRGKDGDSKTGEASAKSLKAAEQAACRLILVEMDILGNEEEPANRPGLPTVDIPEPPGDNPLGRLHERKQRHGGTLNTQCEQLPESRPHLPVFKIYLTFTWKRTTYHATGIGRNKRNAEQVAAETLLAQLPPPPVKAPPSVPQPANGKTQANTNLEQGWSPKSYLYGIAHKHGARFSYTTLAPIQIHGNTIQRATCTFDLADLHVVGEGDGRGITTAEQYASWSVLAQLPEHLLEPKLRQRLAKRVLPKRALTGNLQSLTANPQQGLAEEPGPSSETTAQGAASNSRSLINQRLTVTGGKLSYGNAICEGGTPLQWSVTAIYAENGQTYRETATAGSHKAAQEEAIRLILEQLPSYLEQMVSPL